MNIKRKTFSKVLLASIVMTGMVSAQTAAPEAIPVPAAEVTAPTPAEVVPASEPVVAPSAQEAPVAQIEAAPVEEAAPVPAPVVEIVLPAPVAPVVEAAPAPAPEVVPVAEVTPASVLAPAPKAAPAPKPSKSSFAVVDVPANFEIQAKKVMYKDGDDDPGDNLNQWWGRANLMLLTESEDFKGKVHLRMYPGDLRNNKVVVGEESDGSQKTKYLDAFELYEAWAWQKAKYVNFKLGRWDNTTRPGSFAFGGYVDGYYSGFYSSRNPENMVQFGITATENMSLDVALISKDANLNSGDLRAYFKFSNLSGIEKLDVGIGYRSNVFDEIKNSKGDVTHNIDVALSLPVAKPLRLYGELGLLQLDDQKGNDSRADKGGTLDFSFLVMGGVEIKPGRGLDRIALEAEWCENDDEHGLRVNKEVLGSLMIQKKLTDRFTLTGAVHNEGATKDPAVSARLQGRIN